MKIFFTLLISVFLYFSCRTTDDPVEVLQPESPIENDLLFDEWAPIGAKWYYADDAPGQSKEESTGYYLIESTRDTSMITHNSQTVDARVLEVSYFEDGELKDKRNEVMYGSLDSVYHWDKHEQKFYLLYDFSVNEGDTILAKDKPFINYWGDEHAYFAAKVRSVDTLAINGKELKSISLKSILYGEGNEEGWQYNAGGGGVLLQGIGSTYFMFGGRHTIAIYSRAHWGLRCFEYNGSTYKHEGWNLECDY